MHVQETHEPFRSFPLSPLDAPPHLDRLSEEQLWTRRVMGHVLPFETKTGQVLLGGRYGTSRSRLFCVAEYGNLRERDGRLAGSAGGRWRHYSAGGNDGSENHRS